VSFSLADQYHLHVGDRLPVLDRSVLGAPPPDLSPDEVATALAARTRVRARVPDNRLTIVGIEASPGEFPPQIEGTGRYLIHASPALYPVKDDLAHFSEGADQLMVRLEHGSRDLDGFLRSLDGLGAPNSLVVQRDLATGVNRSVHTQAVALRILALLAAIAGALILGQLLARVMFTEQSDARVLAALGMRRRGRFALGLGRAAMIGVGGGIVAVVTAAAASTFFPTGVARTAEPEPGFHLDLFVLVVGAVGVAALVVVLAAWPAWRAAGTAVESEAVPDRLSFWGRASALAKAPLPVGVGVRMALEPGRGRSALAVRSSLAAVTLGVTTLVAAITFGAGLSHLLATPALYGQSWDVALTTYDDTVPTRGVPVLAADRHVAGVAVGRLQVGFELDGHRVDGLAVDTVDGRLGPTILEGRRPRGGNEIALGTRTLRALGLHVGDVVPSAPFASHRNPVPMRIVGRAVFPLFGVLGRLGDGAFVTTAGWEHIEGRALDPAAEAALIRLAPGAHVGDIVDHLNARLGDQAYGVAVISQGKPTDIVNFGRVEGTPYVLGAVLAAVSIATLAYILVSAVRRRRRDLAVLKTLGFVRGQVRATVACQATTVVAVSLVVGIPLGIAVGRWLWSRFADDLGIVSVPVVPTVAVVLTAVVALVIANLIAAAPAALAARTRPAVVLRSE
jgi:ABC-type antimicrobial peptide transport system permease subunit